jgi:exosortase family protein XrtF
MKANKFIIFFLLKAIGLYALWYLIYDLWLKKSGKFDDWIIDNIVHSSFNILTFLNYNVNVDHHKMWINSAVASVNVGSGCDGLELYVLFAGFVLIFEGSWKHKIWFIPLGVFVIYFLNIIRVIALTLNGLYSKVQLDFNHKYTYTIIMYMVTFAGWMIWVKYFAKTSQTNNEELEVK